MNAQSNKLEYAFKRHGIPYKVVGGMRFFDRAEVKDMLSYLSVTQHPDDEVRLLRIINNPPRGIGAASVEKARELSQKFEVPLFEVIAHAEDFAELKLAAKRMQAFAAMIEDFGAMSQTLPADKLYDEILERTGYIRALEAKQTDENISRVENVKELKTNILAYVSSGGDGNIAGFLEEVALYSDLDTLSGDNGGASAPDYVVMMTMHSAKGLEFDNVFIVGAEEGIFPGYRTIGEPDEMEEERRLCYVAITRARKVLKICCARQRMLFGRTSSNRPSRFVEEIPPEFISLPENPREQPLSEAGLYAAAYAAAGTGMRQNAYAAESGRSRNAFAKKTAFAQKPPLNSVVKAPSDAVSSVVNASSAASVGEQPREEQFAVGDKITHTAFGGGSITAMQSAGNDKLIEISFDDGAVKRFMLRAAERYMKKA